MLDEETIIHQQTLLETYRRNLRHLLRQVAQYGGETTAPIPVINGIQETRANIRQVKAILRATGVTVEDLPDDEPWLRKSTSESYKRHYRKVFISWQRYRSSPALIGVYAESYALRTLSP
jgi:hypothetical protein